MRLGKIVKRPARIIKAAIFVATALLAVIWLGSVVMPNTDREGIWRTFERLEKNSMDVLVFGSSKTFTTFNPPIMWNEYNFTSYDVGGALLDTETMYSYVREAFKTQSPKVVVLDSYTLSDVEEQLNSGQKENVTIMPFGIPKVAAAFSERIPATEAENWILPLKQYHTRLYMPGEVKSGAFVGTKFAKQRKDIYMGYRAGLKPIPQKMTAKPKAIEWDGFERNYKWFERTVEFLESKNCKIIVTISPTANRTTQLNYNNELQRRIEKKYPDVEYLWAYDFDDELKFDYQKDFTDPNHLTTWGAEKWSLYMGKHISELLNEDGTFKTVAHGKTEQLFDQDYKRYMKNYHPVNKQLGVLDETVDRSK